MKSAFKFEISQLVMLIVSDESGEVKGRAEYSTHENAYFVHYRAADGRAVSAWVDESNLVAVKDDAHSGCSVYAATELPDGAVVEG
ncbi:MULTISPECIES: hypothetical protein [Hafniaceae]|uniref:hypothetical protein n=1 Tax=Hafniaceae TaxID=1903412 RepID=UPI0018686A14|nr:MULTISPECIES: hypothetical protein [Hafniaceae]